MERADGFALEDFGELVEAGVEDAEAVWEGGLEGGGLGDGVFVAIDGDDGGTCVEETGGVAAAAEGAVEDGHALARGEGGDDLVWHDWEVVIRGGRGVGRDGEPAIGPLRLRGGRRCGIRSRGHERLAEERVEKENLEVKSSRISVNGRWRKPR